ncbi:uncharacterized protein METZ01_LOCUS308070, partial [marine metagenome]
LPVYEENGSTIFNVSEELAFAVDKILLKEDLKSKPGELLLVYSGDDTGPQRILLIGMGEKSPGDSENF